MRQINNSCKEQAMEEKRAYDNQYYIDHREARLASQAKWRAKRKEEIGTDGWRKHNRIKQRDYYEAKRENWNEYYGDYFKARYKTDVAFKMIHDSRVFMNNCILYVVHKRRDQFPSSIERQMKKYGTTSQELGDWMLDNGYVNKNKVVDHIIPASWLVKTFGLTTMHILLDTINLRVIDRKENCLKHTFIYSNEQLQVAKKLENKYEELKGLTKMVKNRIDETINNEMN